MTADPFAGRVGLVTGAGRGIGKAVALGLVNAGARVALVAHTQAELDAVAAEIRSQDGKPLVIATDIGDPNQIQRALDRVTAEFAPVEVLVNNAAVVRPLRPTASVGPGEWEAAARINVLGPVRLSLAVLPAMIERGWGRIVNVSSGVATNPTAMIGAQPLYGDQGGARGAHSQPRRRTQRHGCNRQRVPARHSRHRDARLDPRTRSQADRDCAHARFVAMQQSGTLLTPQRSAGVLLGRLTAAGNGEIWNAS